MVWLFKNAGHMSTNIFHMAVNVQASSMPHAPCRCFMACCLKCIPTIVTTMVTASCFNQPLMLQSRSVHAKPWRLCCDRMLAMVPARFRGVRQHGYLGYRHNGVIHVDNKSHYCLFYMFFRMRKQNEFQLDVLHVSFLQYNKWLNKEPNGSQLLHFGMYMGPSRPVRMSWWWSIAQRQQWS